MAATVEIHSFPSGSGADISNGNVRFKLADNDTVDTDNPCRIPTADQVNNEEIPTTYSYIKHFKLYIATDPTTAISNLRFFVKQTEIGTGIYLFGDSTSVDHNPPASADSTGDTTCTWSLISGGATHVWSPASPQVVQAGDVLTNGNAPEYDDAAEQDFVTLQLMIDDSASPGTYPAAEDDGVFTYRYDEN